METKTEHPEIADAGRRYLEQYGDPLVTNTYLKIAVLVMALVVAAMSAVVLKEFKQLANIRPLIIRVDQVGHAEAIDYKNFNYKPQESEAKYYLARWVQLAYQRNKYTILNDLTQSTYFLDNNTADIFIKNEHTGKLITAYQKESLPYVEIEVTNVVLGDLSTAPYTAQIEYLKHIKDPQTGADTSTERWTATVNYTFRDTVPNNMIAVNPLGFVIIHYHVDQAFSTQTQAQTTQTQPDTNPTTKLSAGSTTNTR